MRIRRVATTTVAQASLRAFQRHLALWTLQAWLAMFFAGAAFAKLSEPMTLLIPLLGWPDHVDSRLVRAMGGIEMGLAAAMLAPLVSWGWGRPIVIAAGLAIVGISGGMAILHVARMEPGFVALNLCLAVAAVTVVTGRREASPSGLAVGSIRCTRPAPTERTAPPSSNEQPHDS